MKLVAFRHPNSNNPGKNDWTFTSVNDFDEWINEFRETEAEMDGLSGLLPVEVVVLGDIQIFELLSLN